MLLGGLQQVAKLVADGVGLTEGQRLGHLEHQPPLGIGGVDPDRLLQDEVGLGVLLLAGGGGEAGFRQRPPQLVGVTVAADDEAHLADQSDLGLVVIQALAEVLGQLLEDGQVHVDAGDAGKLAGFQNGHRQAGHQHLVAWAYLVEVGLHQTGAQGVAVHRYHSLLRMPNSLTEVSYLAALVAASTGCWLIWPPWSRVK